MVSTPETVRWLMHHVPPAMRVRQLVAELDGVVVGSARSFLHTETSETGHAEIMIVVLPEYQRRGIGAALLAESESYVRELGATTVHTWEHHDHDLRMTGFAGL